METTAPSGLVDIDAAAFADAFARKSVAVHHSLADHPLFTIDAIAELADRLPPDSVRREHGNLPLANYGDYVERVLAVIAVNKRMRRLHLSPRPIGASEPVDRAKAAVVRSLTKLPGKLRA
jgi:hypothetical protein